MDNDGYTITIPSDPDITLGMEGLPISNTYPHGTMHLSMTIDLLRLNLAEAFRLIEQQRQEIERLRATPPTTGGDDTVTGAGSEGE